MKRWSARRNLIFGGAAFAILFCLRMSILPSFEVSKSDDAYGRSSVSFLPHQRMHALNPKFQTLQSPNSTRAWHGIEYTLEQARRAIQPLWICRKDEASQTLPILAFVHIFKTAGSTLRTFLGLYAKVCGDRGWAVLIHCTQANHASIVSGGNWKPCLLKKLQVRQFPYTEEIMVDTRVGRHVNNTLLTTSIDIVGGHFRLGSLDMIPRKVRYVTFVREPLSKYVSGFIFSNRHNQTLTADGVLTEIRRKIVKARKRNEYWLRMRDYLITPEQIHNRKEWLHGPDTVARQVMQNLVSYNVVVGVVERMSNSMRLLEHILDPQHRFRPLFQRYGMETHTERNNSASSVVINRSALSTASIVESLKLDVEFMVLFQEYSKFEDEIYRFSVQQHEAQYTIVSQNQ